MSKKKQIQISIPYWSNSKYKKFYLASPNRNLLSPLSSLLSPLSFLLP